MRVILYTNNGISKNYTHKVPFEQSDTPEVIAEGVWTVLKVPNKIMCIICFIRICFICFITRCCIT